MLKKLDLDKIISLVMHWYYTLTLDKKYKRTLEMWNNSDSGYSDIWILPFTHRKRVALKLRERCNHRTTRLALPERIKNLPQVVICNHCKKMFQK